MTGAAVEAWRAEKTSAWLYEAVAAAEPDPRKRAMFRALADAAETQAGIVARAFGAPPPPFRPSSRARLVARLVRLLGTRRARPLLAAMKVRGLSAYASPAAGGHAPATEGAAIDRSHAESASGSLRAAVFGVNDGLVSNVCLILGVAGSGAERAAVLLAGVAGLVAGAFSMASGEYVSVRSQRELYEHQIAQERDELALYPDEEASELATIYMARGFPAEEALAFSKRLISRPEVALDVLAREELGLDPNDLGSPVGAAASSFLAFCAGALLPLLPVLLLRTVSPVPAVVGVGAIALFAIGAALSLFSGRGALAGGLRMLAIGAGAGAVSFAVGNLLGAAVG